MRPVLELLSYEQLLQAPDPVAGLSRVLAQLAEQAGCDLVVLRVDGPGGWSLQHPVDWPDGLAAFAAVLALPVRLYAVQLGEVTLYWLHDVEGAVAHRQRVMAALPLLALGLSLAGGPGVAPGADVAEAGLLATEALSGGAAHELNNLFTALGFQCEMLRDDPAADPAQVSALERLVARGSDLAAALFRLSKRPDQGWWVPLDDVIAHGLLYLRLIWSGKHLHVDTAGSLPVVLVPAAPAHSALRWGLRYLATTAPRGLKLSLFGRLDGHGRLVLTLAPQADGEPAELAPGTGMGEDASLAALRALLRSVGGDAALARGEPGPQLSLWLPWRLGGG